MNCRLKLNSHGCDQMTAINRRGRRHNDEKIKSCVLTFDEIKQKESENGKKYKLRNLKPSLSYLIVNFETS